MKTARILTFAILTLILFSCCGRNEPFLGKQPPHGAQTLSDALTALEQMATPEGANPAAFAQLKGALRQALIAKGDEKLTSTPPSGATNAVPDFTITDAGGGTADLTWHYYNLGDYNQDGAVGIADITPLAMHFGQGWISGEENKLPAVVDGSGDGTVNIADVTPIAMNFGVEVASYVVESSDAENGIYILGDSIPLSTGLGKDTARMHFTANITPTPAYWYRVKPADSSSNLGVESNAVQNTFNPTPWIHLWGGADTEDAQDIAVDSSGNVYVAGRTVSFGAGGWDVLLLKYDAGGDLVWQRTWGGATIDMGLGIAVDAGGNIYVVGDTEIWGAGDQESMVLKYDPDGNLLWQKTWGGPADDFADGVATDSSGNVYVCGDTDSFGAGSRDIILLKYDSSGNLLWQETWGGTQGQYTKGFTSDSLGNLYFVGFTLGMGAGVDDSFIVKCDSAGALVWQKTWGGTDSDGANDITVNAAGEVYAGGYTRSFGAGGYDAYVLKLDSSGSLLWQRTWGEASIEEAYGLALDGAGNIYASGYSYSFGGAEDAILLEYNADGNLLKERKWGGAQDESTREIAIKGGMIYLGGYATALGSVWLNAPGFHSTPTGTLADATGVFGYPAGSDRIPAGLEASPTGIEDTGGGGISDVLVMKQNPAGI